MAHCNDDYDDEYDDELDDEFFKNLDEQLEKEGISQKDDDYVVIDGPAW